MVFPCKCTTFCNIYVTNLVFFLPYLENIFFRLEKYFFSGRGENGYPHWRFNYYDEWIPPLPACAKVASY